MTKVFLGMSGGVDSSVSAVLLKEQGYDVTGIYMKNWSRDLPGMKCPWAEDLADAKRVAVQLDLDFEVWDFEKDYKQKVVDYMLSEFQKGRTPNPDVMCNELIKFKLFYDRALACGADYIATGHYARVAQGEDIKDEAKYANLLPKRIQDYNEQTERGGTTGFVEHNYKAEPGQNHGPQGSKHRSGRSRKEITVSPFDAATVGVTEARGLRGSPAQKNSSTPAQSAILLRAHDENKDQTYFLYRMSDAATARTIFPLGNMTKPEVKALAAKRGLDVATKKESMGVCFVGEVGMKDFLREYLNPQPGEIRELETGKVLGYHDGAIFYTIGQRHGLYLGGGLPYYVVKKDLKENIVYVSRNLNSSKLWASELLLEDLHLRNALTLSDLSRISNLKVRLRHRAPLIPAEIVYPQNASGVASLHFTQPIKRPASGQSAVFYSGEVCLGGGIIAE